MHESGKLSIVATPIGNLEDVTLRALRTLKEASVIYCEDTRVTKKLLDRYELATPLRRLDANTEMKGAGEVVRRLGAGERVAYCSDAGTPGVSDPGYRLVAAVREAGYTVEAIPGPSALTTALSIAGVPADSFTFLGFLPHKKGRQTLLREMASEPRAVVLYESPHRIERLLASLAELLPSDRQVAVCRELTKLHEQVVTGSARELYEACATGRIPARGEFVVIVGSC